MGSSVLSADFEVVFVGAGFGSGFVARRSGFGDGVRDLLSGLLGRATLLEASEGVRERLAVACRRRTTLEHDSPRAWPRKRPAVPIRPTHTRAMLRLATTGRRCR